MLYILILQFMASAILQNNSFLHNRAKSTYNDLNINKFLKYLYNILLITIKIKFVLLKICFIEYMSLAGRT